MGAVGGLSELVDILTVKLLAANVLAGTSSIQNTQVF